VSKEDPGENYSFLVQMDVWRGEMMFQVSTDSGRFRLTREADFSDSAWHYFAAGFGGSWMSLTVDDEPAVEGAARGRVLYGDAAMIVGSDVPIPGWDNQLYGAIDELRILDRAPSPVQELIALPDDTLDFGFLPLDSAADRRLGLCNIGDSALIAAAPPPVEGSPFHWEPLENVEIASEDTLPVQIGFAPRAEGEFRDVFRVRYLGGELEVALRGQAGLAVGNPTAQLPDRVGIVAVSPNPFNAQTTIKYELSQPVVVTIDIYDILGREIVVLMDDTKKPGYYSLLWDGHDGSGKPVASGLYFCRMQAGDFVKTIRVVMNR
jgi:hypothetical protein